MFLLESWIWLTTLSLPSGCCKFPSTLQKHSNLRGTRLVIRFLLFSRVGEWNQTNLHNKMISLTAEEQHCRSLILFNIRRFNSEAISNKRAIYSLASALHMKGVDCCCSLHARTRPRLACWIILITCQSPNVFTFFAIIKLNFQWKFVQCFDISRCNEIKIGVLWIANFFFRFFSLPFGFHQRQSMATNERITYGNGRLSEITFKFDAIYISTWFSLLPPKWSKTSFDEAENTIFASNFGDEGKLIFRCCRFFHYREQGHWMSLTGYCWYLSLIYVMSNLCIKRPPDWQAICKFTRHFISTKYDFK